MRDARLQEDASLCILSCPPARHRDWCCSGSSSSPSHRAHRILQGSFPSQILRRLPRSKGKQVACVHTHTLSISLTAVGALRINIIYHARRFMRTCVHARINAGMTQFFLLARLLLFENPYSLESLLLAKRCMQVHVCVYICVCLCMCRNESKSVFSRGTAARKAL